MYNSKMHPAEQLCDVMRRVTGFGLGTVAGGGAAIRDLDGSVWMTPHGISKNTLTPAVAAKYTASGELLTPVAGTDEAPVNIEIFKVRPDLSAVLHTHSPGMLGFMLSGSEPDFRAVASAAALVKSIGGAKTVPFYVPGSPELVKVVSEAFAEGYNVVFLDGHGVFVGADTIYSAYKTVEVIDNLCDTLLYAPAFGEVKYLTDEQVESYAAKRAFVSFGSFETGALPLEEGVTVQKLITMAARGYQKRIINNLQGVVSSRVSDSMILVTPDDVNSDKSALEPHELVRVDIKNALVESGKKAPADLERLIAIYRAHPEYTGMAIACPCDTMGFAVTDAEMNTYTDFEIFMGVHKIKKLPFGASPETIAAAFGNGVTCVMVENDCIITVSFLDTLKGYGCLECCSAIAGVLIKQKVAGKQATELPRAMVDEAFFEKTGQKS